MAGHLEPSTVNELIDNRPLSAFQVRVLVLCGTVMLLDGFDTQSIGFLAPAIARELGIPLPAFGPVFSAGLTGLMLGAMASGPLADRFGRKIVIIMSTVIFGVFTFLTPTATTVSAFVTLRFLTGLGLGGAMPNIVALTAEYSPKRLQATIVAALFAGMPLGAVVASLVSSQMLPLWGWRSVFYLGGVLPLMVAALLIFLMPESVRFLAATAADPRRIAAILKRISPELEHHKLHVPVSPAVRGLSVRQLFADGRAVATVLLWIPFFMNLLLLYFFINWLPGLLTTIGMPVQAGVTAAGLFSLGGVIGSLIQGPLMMRRGASIVLICEFALSVVLIIAMASATSFALMMTATCILGIAIQGAQAGINALSATFYPTAIRSTGVGWALGVGRVGSIVGPMVAGVLLAREWTPPQIFLAGSIPALIAGLAVVASHFLVRNAGAYSVNTPIRSAETAR